MWAFNIDNCSYTAPLGAMGYCPLEQGVSDGLPFTEGVYFQANSPAPYVESTFEPSTNYYTGLIVTGSHSQSSVEKFADTAAHNLPPSGAVDSNIDYYSQHPLHNREYASPAGHYYPSLTSPNCIIQCHPPFNDYHTMTPASLDSQESNRNSIDEFKLPLPASRDLINNEDYGTLSRNQLSKFTDLYPPVLNSDTKLHSPRAPAIGPYTSDDVSPEKTSQGVVDVPDDREGSSRTYSPRRPRSYPRDLWTSYIPPLPARHTTPRSDSKPTKPLPARASACSPPAQATRYVQYDATAFTSPPSDASNQSEAGPSRFPATGTKRTSASKGDSERSSKKQCMPSTAADSVHRRKATSSGSTTTKAKLARDGNDSVKQRWPCPEEGCTKDYNRKHDVKRHIRTAHRKERVPCSYCGTDLGRDDSLRRHWPRCPESNYSKPTGSVRKVLNVTSIAKGSE